MSASVRPTSPERAAAAEVIRQHLIDPEICIRCNTCEETCPIDAITHDARNYVVDVAICNGCNACISPCPTGAIDNWRQVARARAYSLERTASRGTSLPAQADRRRRRRPRYSAGDRAHHRGGERRPGRRGAAAVVGRASLRQPAHAREARARHRHRQFRADRRGRVERHPPHRARFRRRPRFRCWKGRRSASFRRAPTPQGRPHYVRLYSVASPRDGERPRYNNVALTVKRVTEDHAGNAVRGVASNYLCDLGKGDAVSVVGPFGASFLMPNHPGSSLLMICTGTGSAPMRAMTERRRRRIAQKEGGELMLFFGARAEEELPYFGPLMKLPRDFIDINFAFSRVPGQPKQYVQDLIRAPRRRCRAVAARRAVLHLRLRPEEHGGRRRRGIRRHLPRARHGLGRAAARRCARPAGYHLETY